jgi:hypothetical protein
MTVGVWKMPKLVPSKVSKESGRKGPSLVLSFLPEPESSAGMRRLRTVINQGLGVATTDIPRMGLSSVPN